MIEVAIALDDGWDEEQDWEELAQNAVEAAFRHSPFAPVADGSAVIEVSVKFAENDEVQRLNAAYRSKDKPTNVLSFPMVQRDLIEGLANSDDGEVLLGDIILARGVCEAEATEKGIPVAEHATHLIVHGTLHLLGYDHMGDAEAETMEDLERAALAALGLGDPYAIDDL